MQLEKTLRRSTRIIEEDFTFFKASAQKDTNERMYNIYI